MKKILIYSVFACFLAASCVHVPELPMETLSLETTSLNAPSGGATYTVSLVSNTAWVVENLKEAQNSWAQLSCLEGTGGRELSVVVRENTEQAPRDVVFTFVSKKDASLRAELRVSEKGIDGAEFISVSALRALEGEEVPAGTCVRGFVVNSQKDGNYLEGTIALQDSFSQRASGIAVAVPEGVEYPRGAEVIIEAGEGTSVCRRDEGVLVVQNAKVTLTDTTPLGVEPIVVKSAEVVSGVWESMYVKLARVQVADDAQTPIYADCPAIATALGDTLRLVCNENASFAADNVDLLSGSAAGIAGCAAEKPILRPTMASDVNLRSNRFGTPTGIQSLPYVFSLYCTTQTNADMKYSTMVSKGTYEQMAADFLIKDNVAKWGVNLTACATGGSAASNFRMEHWANNTANDNVPGKSFQDKNHYYMLTLPVLIDLPSSLSVTFGFYVTGAAIADWTLSYSKDKETWYTAGTVHHERDGRWFAYQLRFDLEEPVYAADVLYLKLYPSGKTRPAGTSTSGLGSDARLANGFAICPIYEGHTPRPEGAVYFEAFDGLTGGLDYFIGDRLGALANFTGDDIDQWTPSLLGGLTGSNVRQRPGYVQIGFVDTYTAADSDYVNNVGVLTTPALGVSGDFTLSFDASAYRTHAIRPNHSGNTPADAIKGDLTSMVVEILGGGTIDGAVKKKIEELPVGSWEHYTLNIEGATEETQIRFTSDAVSQTTAVAAASRVFSRYFLDNITIKFL